MYICLVMNKHPSFAISRATSFQPQ